jgi:hypothetical protein
VCLPFQPHGEYTVVGGVIVVIIPNNRYNIKTGDLERGLARIMMNRATGRDMVRKKVFDFVGYFANFLMAFLMRKFQEIWAVFNF